jgi:hypothetical protein
MMLLSTKDVLSVTGLPAMTLSRWIGKGWVRPPRQGHQGRGLSYGFTPCQAFGLAVCAAVHEVCGNAAKFVRDNMHVYHQPDEAEEEQFLDWALDRRNPYREEAAAAARARGERVGIVLPDCRMTEVMCGKIAALLELLKERHGIPAGRCFTNKGST